MNLKFTTRQLLTSAMTIAATSLTLLASSSSAKAADAAAATATNAPPKPHWESIASADLTMTRGNSHTFLGAVTINSTRKSAKDEILLGGSAGYGDTTTKQADGSEEKTETANFLKGYAQWNHLFTEKLYGGLRFDALRDNVADIHYRFTVGPLAGYYFIKQTNVFLCGEIGPSYVNQDLGGVTSDYIALRLAERFEYKFKTGAKIWETLEWLPQVDKFDNWIMNAEVGISAPVSKALDVRLVAQDTYNNQPAAGRQKNDFKLLAGIGVRF
ncbi:MAG TPA: DUF481 domain-containing protein [Candidatus Limnocylindrales bacterium]|jgi:hypothetical protein|nr:DUF481 domain-containing protein [Candidatus Limnocylindrales bacterium]